MKSLVTKLVHDAIASMPELATAAAELALETTVERTRDPAHGDFATNIAMRLAKAVGMQPRALAEKIIAAFPANDEVSRLELAGPGFINIHLHASALHREVAVILQQGANYGRQPKKASPRILLEFVSANPTGPLHVGHGRHGAYGATVGNLLQAAGYDVDREYYVNDAGRQMDILGLSVWLRWLEVNGTTIAFPSAGYRGEYIRDIAAAIDMQNAIAVAAEVLLDGVPADAPVGDKETHIGALIERARKLLGAKAFHDIRQQSLESIRQDIEQDLAEFGVTFDRWFSEQSLETEHRIDAALAVLKDRGMLYQKDGATWFRAEQFGDEKDRVVIRENGIKTYFASDIAYHFDKRQRGYDYLIDILGSDHHGYAPRVRAGLVAMGYEAESLEVELMQFVALYRSGEKLSMSTRSGEFVTLRELRAEVGNDAARLFYVMRSNDQHLDFDLELAKSHSNDNPVYYIQYAHARIASVFRQLEEKQLEHDAANGIQGLAALTEPQERALLSSLTRYPEVILLAANNRAPQHLVHYLRDLANDFHSYYNAHAFIVEVAALRDARLSLVAATRIVISNGLDILGVSAPEKM